MLTPRQFSDYIQNRSLKKFYEENFEIFDPFIYDFIYFFCEKDHHLYCPMDPHHPTRPKIPDGYWTDSIIPSHIKEKSVGVKQIEYLLTTVYYAITDRIINFDLITNFGEGRNWQGTTLEYRYITIKRIKQHVMPNIAPWATPIIMIFLAKRGLQPITIIPQNSELERRTVIQYIYDTPIKEILLRIKGKLDSKDIRLYDSFRDPYQFDIFNYIFTFYSLRTIRSTAPSKLDNELIFLSDEGLRADYQFGPMGRPDVDLSNSLSLISSRVFIFTGNVTFDYKTKSKCFVVTACMGSYSHPYVITLQQFRDRFLVKYTIGKMFIQIYERIGPNLADYIENNTLLRSIIKMIIIRPAVKCVKLFRLDDS